MAQFNENIELLNASGITVQLKNQTAEISAGGQNQNGSIILKNGTGQARITLSANSGDITAGGNGVVGDLFLKADAGNRIVLMGATADVTIGGNGATGDITLKNDTNQNRARLLGDGNLWLGGNGGDGDIVLFKTAGDNTTLETGTIHLDGEGGDIRLGCSGTQGDLVLKGDNNQNRVRLLGDANMWIGGNGADGDIVVFKSDGDNTTLDNATIHLDGQSGNIRCNDVNIPGADFAEDFDICTSIADILEPGTVMVLGRDGKLLESTEAFDRKVAGVVSGAGKYKPGITLDKQPGLENRMPIALSGKVMCKIDASYGAIMVGDLITTSPRKGYAMKATDPMQAFGAVIGKALADFPSGDGMLPILVALQ